MTVMAEYRKYSDQQKALANSIDLVDYLRSNGETLIKSGREYRWQRYTSVTVRDNKWFKHKSQEGGYPIKFLEEFYGYNYQDAMELLLSYANDTGTQIVSEQEEQKEVKPFELPPSNPDMKKAYAYLLKTRYIDQEIIDFFVQQGLIYEDAKYHNVVFVGADEDGIARHAHKKSTYTKGEQSYRGNVEGSDPRYSFHYKGSNENLFVFEAPIDMLSYISLAQHHWQENSYVALCGLGMQAMDTMLEQNPDIRCITLATDHDVAGSEGVERMIDHLKEQGYDNIIIKKPLFKDFNEDLKAKYGLSPQDGIENPNYKIAEDMIMEQKNHFDYACLVQHKDLSKAFADMYYGLNHESQRNYAKLKEDFQLITECALNLEHQCLYPDSAFNDMSETFDHLQEDYRSYKDKGSFKKRIESIKKAFQSVKLVMNENGTKQDLGEAYRKLASESFMMITDSQRQLMKQQGNVQSQKQENMITQRTRPQSPLIGSDGNIFNLMGVATRSLNEANKNTEAEEMCERIMKSGSYEEALNIMMEYVEPVEAPERGLRGGIQLMQ